MAQKRGLGDADTLMLMRRGFIADDSRQQNGFRITDRGLAVVQGSRGAIEEDYQNGSAQRMQNGTGTVKQPTGPQPATPNTTVGQNSSNSTTNSGASNNATNGGASPATTNAAATNSTSNASNTPTANNQTPPNPNDLAKAQQLANKIKTANPSMQSDQVQGSVQQNIGSVGKSTSDVPEMTDLVKAQLGMTEGKSTLKNRKN